MAAGFKLALRAKPKPSKGEDLLAKFQRKRLPYICSRNEVFLSELRRRNSSKQHRMKPARSYRSVVYQSYSPVDRSQKSLNYALNHCWEMPRNSGELVQRPPSLEPSSICRRCSFRRPLPKPEMVDEFSDMN